MYNYQKGLLPISLNFLSIFIPGVFFVFAAKTLLPLYINSIETQLVNEIIRITFNLLMGLAIYLILPLFIGILLSGVFPAVTITKKGIGYMYFGGLIKGEILWKEIIALRKLTGGYSIIIMNRSGVSIFNGLYINSLYGRLVGVLHPILFLSPGLTNRESVILSIKNNLQN